MVRVGMSHQAAVTEAGDLVLYVTTDMPNVLFPMLQQLLTSYVPSGHGSSEHGFSEHTLYLV